MKISFNYKEQKKYLLVQLVLGSVLSMMMFFLFLFGELSLGETIVGLVPFSLFWLFVVWQRIRVNGRKTYPTFMDDLDKSCGVKPLEK